MDILFIILLYFVFKYTMIKHGRWTNPTGAGDFLAWSIICFMALGLIKAPILWLWTGVHFPIQATNGQHIVASSIAIVVWFVMMYWRIPRTIYLWIRNK